MKKPAAVCTLAILCLCCVVPALAQSYPTRPIRMVIPWPAGGITDVIARAGELHHRRIAESGWRQIEIAVVSGNGEVRHE